MRKKRKHGPNGPHTGGGGLPPPHPNSSSESRTKVFQKSQSPIEVLEHLLTASLSENTKACIKAWKIGFKRGMADRKKDSQHKISVNTQGSKNTQQWRYRNPEGRIQR